MGSANRLPPGVRDFLPRAAARRRAICAGLLEQFDRWGYQRIITPQFEVAEVLERGLGPQQRRDAVRFIEPGSGDVVALRPDITPQVARIAATRLGDVEGPLRLCYEGAVTRSGGARVQQEILQAGIELIGAGSPTGDAEAMALAAEVLLAIGGQATRLEIGHVGPAHHVLAAADESTREQVRDAMGRRDMSAIAVLAQDFPRALRELVRELPRLTGSVGAMKGAAARLGDVVARPFDEIRRTLEAAKRLAPAAMEEIDVSIDFGEVRGFPYYTGIRLAGWLPGAGDAVLVGGRYDSLVARYGRERLATGFAVDVEAVAEAEPGERADDVAQGGVLVVGDRRAEALAASLRRAGHRAALEIGGLESRDSLVRYAEASGLATVVVLKRSGADRIAAGDVTRVTEAVVAAAVQGKKPALRALVQGDR